MLTVQDKEWLEKKLKETTCACGLHPDAQDEVPHFFGMVKDAGGGDYAKGVEKFRGIAKRDARYVRIVRTIEGGAAATVTGWLILRLIEAAKAWLMKGGHG